MYNYPYPPYPPFMCPPSGPTLDQLREYRKSLDEYEKEVLDKDKKKKEKSPRKFSNLETVLTMMVFAPIIFGAELLMGLAAYQWMIAPVLFPGK